jgi:3-oxoacyl-[acyl-carrier-protein] synthase III
MIKYVNYFVPDLRLSCETIFSEAEKKEKLPQEFKTAGETFKFFKDTIDLVEVTDANSMSEVDMLSLLLDDFFNKDLVEKHKIDTIIVIADELVKGTRMQNIGHYLQHTYTIENAEILTLAGNHCSNIEYAISYGESLLKSGDFNNILILAVNKVVRNEERIAGNYAVHGDGAAIVFLNKDSAGGIKLEGKHSYTNGILYEANLDTNNSFLLCKNYLVCLSQFLKKYEISPSEISSVIVQNANYFLINQCLNSLGFKNEQIFTEKISSYGHLDCIDFVVNLKTLLDKNPEPSKKIMSFGIGWAGSNICLLMEVI